MMAYGAGDGNWAKAMLTETPSVSTSQSKCQPFRRMLSLLQNCGHLVNIIYQKTFLTSHSLGALLLVRLGMNKGLFGIMCSSLRVQKPGCQVWHIDDCHVGIARQKSTTAMHIAEDAVTEKAITCHIYLNFACSEQNTCVSLSW